MNINSPYLISGDCIEQMQKLPAGSVDMVLCDLPYGTTANKWDSIIPLDKLWEQWKRVCKPGAAIVLFTQQPFTTTVAASNLKQLRTEWIWRKPQGTGFLNANRYPLKSHENILVFCDQMPRYTPQKTFGHKPYSTKQKAATSNYGQFASIPTINTDGSRFPNTILEYAAERGHHPTQKPIALCEYLIRTYTNEGDTVLDCCMGSGTTGVAAVNTSRRFVGIERDAAYFKIAQERISAAQEKINMNPLQDIKTAATDVAHGVEKAIAFLPNALSLLDHAIKDEPTVKTLLSNLVQNASSVLTAGTIAADDKGISLTADAAVLAAAEQFFIYFKDTFLPQAEAMYKGLSATA